jgi:NTE family protein
MLTAGTALVLGGGGVTGVAWEVGMLTGLFEAGVDLSTAELVVGTSAGAAVAAQLTSGVPFAELFARQVAGTSNERPAALQGTTLLRYVWAMVRERDPQRFGARMGRLALGAKTISEPERRAVIASRLPRHEWPDRPMQLTAVNARTGEFRVFDRSSNVPLVDAVAASCAVPGVWPPVTLGEAQWIDGGMRSAANVDLAAGRERVVVLAPITTGFGPMASAASQVKALRAQGARVVLLSPDQAARQRMGRNSLDPSMRAPAAREGHRQAADVVREVADLWSTASASS